MYPLHNLLAVLACGGTSAPEAPPLPDPATLPDVVLITLDTTRADRLGSYGHELAKTEHMDELAARGRRYDRAYSPLPLTIPSHASLFTGMYPPTLKIRTNGRGKLSLLQHTLTEALGAAGYETGASVAAFVTSRVWGFEQGFGAYYDDIPEQPHFWHAERPAEAVVDDIVAWAEDVGADAPRFAWVHLYDAHFPWLPPAEYLELIPKRPYDGEIAYMDDQVGRLVEAFTARPTLFVVVGDHGESLGDHHELQHGLFVYDSTQRVPWIMAGPGIETAVVDQAVSLVDVAPTLLAHLGLPPLPDAEGRAVPDSVDRPVYLESYQATDRFGLAPSVAVVDGHHKLIDLPRPELYDLSADPGETEDLAAGAPDEVARLQGLLAGFGFAEPEVDPATVDPAAAQQLEALGYVEGTFTGDTSGPLPDPKDQLDLIGESQKVDRAMLEGKLAEADEQLERLIEEYPDVVEFTHSRATVLDKLGRLDEVGPLLDRALERAPTNLALRSAKATALAREGSFEEAAILFQEVAEEMPYSPRIRAHAVSAMLEVANGSTKAIELGLSYLDDFPNDYAVAGLIGVEMIRRGFMAQGLKLLKRGALADRPERTVCLHLAAAATGRGEIEEAIRLLERELEHYPGNADAIMALARMRGLQQDWLAQVSLTERFVEVRPGDPSGWHLHAQALYNVQRYADARVALDKGLAIDADLAILLLLDANLLKQEGHMDKALARFEEAKASRAREEEEAAKALQAPAEPPEAAEAPAPPEL